MNFLQGYKTYIVAIAMGVVTVIHALGWIDDTTFQTIMGLLGGGGLAFLRMGIKQP